MFVVSLINQKGGVGKSTLALCLAVAFQQAGRNTLILDLDPQASAAEWHDARESKLPHVESIQPSRLKKTAESAREIGTEILILDTAPHSEATSIEAARMSDLVLIPCQPSIMDLRAMSKTIDLMKLVSVPAYAVINGVQHHSRGAALQAEKTIERALKMPVAPIQIGERVVYSRALISGQTPLEVEPDGKAAQELKRLHRWVTQQLEETRKAA